jgi:toxin ParE1/3/4
MRAPPAPRCCAASRRATRPAYARDARPRFIDDLSDAYAYIAERSPRSGDRLLDEVEAVVALLTAFPEVGRRRDELRANVRSFRVRRFGYILFYRTEPDQVVLLRLIHGALDVKSETVAG